jgi:hypothetical protein
MANELVRFQGAQLPAAGIGRFKQALQVARDNAHVSSGTPFLRLLKGNGYFVYGQKNIEVEEGSEWAVNPMSLQVGFIAWKGGKPVDKKMRSIFQPAYTRDELPDVGAEWDANVSMQLMCVHGEDKGTVVEYQANSVGGRKAFDNLAAELQAQSDKDPENIVPVVDLISDSYQHAEYGKIHNPIFKVVRWMAMDTGNAGAAPEAEEPKAAAKTETTAPKQEAAAPTRRRAAGPVTDVEETKETPKAEAPAADPAVRRRRRAA